MLRAPSCPLAFPFGAAVAGKEQRITGSDDAHQRGAPKEEYTWGGNPEGGGETSEASWPRLSCVVIPRGLHQPFTSWEVGGSFGLDNPLVSRVLSSSSRGLLLRLILHYCLDVGRVCR